MYAIAVQNELRAQAMSAVLLIEELACWILGTLPLSDRHHGVSVM